MKRCLGECGRWLPMASFDTRLLGKARLRSRKFTGCDTCCVRCRAGIRLRKYGITYEDFIRILVGQDGACAVCRDRSSPVLRLVVDHDHQTGKVRGLVCQPCNLMLGFAKDESWRLMRGMIYLERHAAKRETA